jgi:hypothetical protein
MKGLERHSSQYTYDTPKGVNKMKAWKVWYETRSGDVITDVYTKWSDVLYLQSIGSLVEMQEITITE